ncbi:MAG: DUF342 domain-containing protein [Deltaproteobacteria bacterium]|nr:DUF342 domain-containing protein [Candidatus Anaeroferrophillacea bacterium]
MPYRITLHTAPAVSDTAPGEVIDHYERLRLANVVCRQVVARIAPHDDDFRPEVEETAANGQPFFIVTDPRELLGENVAVLEDDPTAIVSTIDGLLTLDHNRISVRETMVIDGDISFRTGNLTCIGGVEIRGSVLSGFSVRAKTVVIEGSIEGASVTTDGDLLVRGGIIGCEHGTIFAGGSIHARYVENSHIRALKNIFVVKSVLHSHLTAGASIVLLRAPGVLVGGSARAVHNVCALTVGSKWGTPTVIRLGVNPFREDELEDLHRQDDHRRQEIEHIAGRVSEIRLYFESATATPNPEEIGRLDEERRLLESKLACVTNQRRSLARRMQVLAAAIRLEIATGTRGRLYVFETLHPGVALSIKESSLNSDAVHSSIYLYEEDQQIRIGKP